MKRYTDRTPKFYFSCLLGTIAGVMIGGCSAQNPKSRFLLAEELWQEGKYQAAVSEYERVVLKEQGSELGLQSAYRAATTEALFLKEYSSAIKKFTKVIELGKESPLAHESYRQIGELLFNPLEQYSQAITHYQKMLVLFPGDPDRERYEFRIGKSFYFLTEFEKAIATFEELAKREKKTEWSERALYEVGVSYQTWGNRKHTEGKSEAELFKKAIEQFNRFIETYPGSALALQAKFELGSCYEELDRYEEAEKIYASLRGIYPSPQVVEIKLQRIKKRRELKKQ